MPWKALVAATRKKVSTMLTRYDLYDLVYGAIDKCGAFLDDLEENHTWALGAIMIFAMLVCTCADGLAEMF